MTAAEPTRDPVTITAHGHRFNGVTWQEALVIRGAWVRSEVKHRLFPLGGPAAGTFHVTAFEERFTLLDQGRLTELMDHGKLVAWFKITSEFPESTFTVEMARVEGA